MDSKLRILVVNGSPKGDYSLTLQHSLYMLGQEPSVEWTVLQAGEALSPIDYDESWLRAAIDEI
ncbi:MAG TPA: iron-sulfur protein, partial [Spirochaetales bacterium]|nr:iron-sulfur protein [Spirochaetales bacterium]